MTLQRLAVRFIGGLGMAGVAACGGKSPMTPSPPVQTSIITITSSGVSPKNIQVTPGTRVQFVNNDSRPHDMASDPHPSHENCIEINQVGVIMPGQTKETGNLITERTCGYHDHELFTNTSLQGSIVIKQ